MNIKIVQMNIKIVQMLNIVQMKKEYSSNESLKIVQMKKK